MRNKSYKITKLERNRKSIITNDLEHCYVCGSRKQHLHEIYYGNNRNNSLIYDMVMPICFECHHRIHNDIEMDLYYKKLFQKEFEKTHTREKFIKIFYKSYL